MVYPNSYPILKLYDVGVLLSSVCIVAWSRGKLTAVPMRLHTIDSLLSSMHAGMTAEERDARTARKVLISEHCR